MVVNIAIKVLASFAAMILVLLAIPALFGRAARIRRKLRSAEQCAIGELAQASGRPRRIAGMVVAVGEPLIAPLTGRACVFYETRVVRAVGLGMEPWDIKYTFASETRGVPFLIDDGTGTAVVDPASSRRLLELDIDRWSTERDDDTAAEDAFLTQFGRRRRGLLFEKRLHFTESIIEVGERIAVVGVPRHEPAAPTSSDSPYRQHDAPPAPSRMTRSAGSALIVTDDLTFAPPLGDE